MLDPSRPIILAPSEQKRDRGCWDAELPGTHPGLVSPGTSGTTGNLHSPPRPKLTRCSYTESSWLFFLFGPRTLRVEILTPTSCVFGAQAVTRQGRGDRVPSVGAKVAALPVPLASDSAGNRGGQVGGRGSASSAWLQLLGCSDCRSAPAVDLEASSARL